MGKNIWIEKGKPAAVEFEGLAGKLWISWNGAVAVVGISLDGSVNQYEFALNIDAPAEEIEPAVENPTIGE